MVITSPTFQSTYSTESSPISLAGTASDDNGISSIAWSASNGQSGTTTASSSWQIDNLSLSEGQNVITVTVTDTAGQSSSDSISITFSPVVTNTPVNDGSMPFKQAWDAQKQTADPDYTNSSVTYCVRLLIQGEQIELNGGEIQLGFRGRTSGDYSIRKVSIAERDVNAQVGDVLDGTWTKVLFDGQSDSAWSSYSVIVSEGQEKLSDIFKFDVVPGKDYYVTFKIDAPSVYLDPPSDYRELYFENEDHTEDIDWSGNGYSLTQDYHALAKVYVRGVSGFHIVDNAN